MDINNKSTNKNPNLKLLTVARLSPPKRVDLLINVLENLSNVELHVIGDGNLRGELERIKQERVYFHGEIDGFDDFSSYDIFALVSDSEGLPLSALEAMSAGLPIVLSDVGGCFELIDNNGILVQNNINKIKEGIIICINNLEEFGKQSKIIFDKQFNLELNKNEYLDYYETVLQG